MSCTILTQVYTMCVFAFATRGHYFTKQHYVFIVLEESGEVFTCGEDFPHGLKWPQQLCRWSEELMISVYEQCNSVSFCTADTLDYYLALLLKSGIYFIDWFDDCKPDTMRETDYKTSFLNQIWSSWFSQISRENLWFAFSSVHNIKRICTWLWVEALHEQFGVISWGWGFWVDWGRPLLGFTGNTMCTLAALL